MAARGSTKSPQKHEKRRAFAVALDVIAQEEGVSQAELARRLGMAQQTISKYIAGESPPENPDTVFEMEAKLGLPPGYLSHHLGYLPLTYVPTASSIEADPRLSPASRTMLMRVYRTLLAWEQATAEGVPST